MARQPHRDRPVGFVPRCSEAVRLDPPARAALAVATVTILVGLPLASLVGGAPDRDPGTAALEPAPLASGTVGSLRLNATASFSLAPSFWGVDVRPYSSVDAAAASELQATPVSYVVWPGGTVADGYNATANVIYDSNGSTYAPPSNESQFVAWCELVDCHAIVQVPAEIDSPSTAAFYVAYTEDALHFHPDLWEIGNEPARWTHYEVPWSEWSSSQASRISAVGYADLVHRFLPAMRAVDPNLRVLGLPGLGTGGSGESTWIHDTVEENGPNLSGVAIHAYPAGSGPSNPTLAQFYASLTEGASLPSRVAADRAAILSACSECGPIPVFVTELGSANGGGSYATYLGAFPNVPYLAAEVVQAMDLNLSNVDLFAFRSDYGGSWFAANGSVRPDYPLYADLLKQLGPVVVPVTTYGTPGGLFVVGTADPARGYESLLLSNTNVSSPADLSLAGSGFPFGNSGEAWTWNESSSGPVVQNFTSGLASVWTLPPESVAVLRVASLGAPIVLPDPSTIGTLTTFSVAVHGGSPPYSYRWHEYVTGIPDPGNVSSFSGIPTGRGTWEVYCTVSDPSGWSASSDVAKVIVEGTNYTLTTATQPSNGGTIVPSAGTHSYPSGRSVTLNETPAAGFAFLRWVGTGYGSYSGALPGPSVTVDANLTETATFGALYTVAFEDAGLPPLANWSVSLNGVALSSGNGSLVFTEPNGTYSYEVNPVPGYSSRPASGEVFVAGTSVSIPIAFEAFLSVGAFAADPSSVRVGDPTALEVTVSGGAGPYSFAYSGLPEGCASANTSVLSCTPSSAGTFRIEVQVTDAWAGSAFANASLTVSAPVPLTVSAPTIRPNPSHVGALTWFSVAVSGGTPPYVYDWHEYVKGIPNPGSTSSFSGTPAKRGQWDIYCTVTDSIGRSVQSSVTVYVVKPAPARSSGTGAVVLGPIRIPFPAVSGLGVVFPPVTVLLVPSGRSRRPTVRYPPRS